jgi:hypothetical protein
MRTISERTASKYLKGSDLPADDSPVYVYIHDVVEEEVGSKKREELVISFADANGKPALKPYICSNVGNQKRLGKDIANDPAKWPGHQVRVWAVDSTTPDGEHTRGVRIAGARQQPVANPLPTPAPLPPVVVPPAQPPELITAEQLKVPAVPAVADKPNGQAADLNDDIPF